MLRCMLKQVRKDLKSILEWWKEPLIGIFAAIILVSWVLLACSIAEKLVTIDSFFVFAGTSLSIIIAPFILVGLDAYIHHLYKICGGK